MSRKTFPSRCNQIRFPSSREELGGKHKLKVMSNETENHHHREIK
jgi:hypothetical protein